jgi:prepilin-type N-terminal cleavage/methylation domain-containing protein
MLTTAPKYPFRSRRSRRDGGFTMIELLVAAFISAIILSAVLTVFLMIGKIQTNAGYYIDMERDAQRALERFSEDARMATKVTTVAAATIIDITLTVPHTSDSGTDSVRYYYDSTNKAFIRIGPDPVTGVANTTTTLATNVQSCSFKPWKLASIGPATNDLETDLLQIQLLMKKQRATAVGTTDLVVSASYLLRNHKTNT